MSGPLLASHARHEMSGPFPTHNRSCGTQPAHIRTPDPIAEEGFVSEVVCGAGEQKPLAASALPGRPEQGQADAADSGRTDGACATRSAARHRLSQGDGTEVSGGLGQCAEGGAVGGGSPGEGPVDGGGVVNGEEDDAGGTVVAGGDLAQRVDTLS